MASRPQKKQQPRQPQPAGSNWAGKLVMGFFIVGALAAASVLAWKNQYLPSFIARAETTPFVIDGAGAPAPTPVAAQTPGKTDLPPAATPKPANNTFYDIKTEPVGNVPDKWRVEQVEGLKAKTKSIVFSNGAEYTFVVPPYQLLPEQVTGGLYVIEPGREATGGGTTLPDVIDRYNSETDILRNTLEALDATLEDLSRLKKAPPAAASKP